MTHREYRTAHHHKSYLARASNAQLGPTSHHNRNVWNAMQSCRNRRTKPESKCSCEQNTPPQELEAGSLTKCTVFLA
jgi:hypothetical protein